MKKNNSFKIIMIITLFVCMYIFMPNNVFAKDIECRYEDSNYKMNIYINENGTSAKANIKTFGGNSLNKDNVAISNWDSLAKDIKSHNWKEDEMCPNYVFTWYCNSGAGAPSAAVTQVYQMKAYYKESTAKSAQKDQDTTCGFGTTPGTKSSIVELSRVKNSKGKTTKDSNKPQNIVDNDNSKYSTCQDILGESVVEIIQTIFNYLKIFGPIIVLVLSSLDFTKVVMSGDEKAMKGAQRNLAIRLGCAFGVYFLPILITIVVNIIFGEDITGPLCGIK